MALSLIFSRGRWLVLQHAIANRRRVVLLGSDFPATASRCRDWLGSAAEWFYDPSQDEATPGFLARGRADAIRVRKLSAKEDEEHDCVGGSGYELCTPYDVVCYVESRKDARLFSSQSPRRMDRKGRARCLYRLFLILLWK